MLETPESQTVPLERKTVGLDNQHAMHLAWLAGLFDGEGSLTIGRDERRKHTRLIARFSISNTDPNIIERVQDILIRHGFHPYVYEQDRADWKKVCYHIQVNRRVEIKMIIEMLMPHMVGKKAKAAMMLRFIEAQLKNNYDECETVFTELKTANTRGKPSETTRAPVCFMHSEDIVHAQAVMAGI
jgi:hypothetical protein